MGNRFSNDKKKHDKIDSHKLRKKYTNIFTYNRFDISDQLLNLPNDLEELIINYMTRDLTNLPPSLQRIIIRCDDYQHYYFEEELSKDNIEHDKYYITVPYGCQIYSKDKNDKLKLINNFCGFIEYRKIVHHIGMSSVEFIKYN
jgi:hypothetical protein